MKGIVSYGFYVPSMRITTEEIAKVWGKDPLSITKSLGIYEKTVASSDEDSLTMGFEAAAVALKQARLYEKDIDKKIEGVFFGSETPSYAVNPTSTTIATFLGIHNQYNAYDTQFACKAATGSLVSGLALVSSGINQYCLCIGSDKANSKPGDALEFSAGSAAVALVVGTQNVAIKVLDTLSYSSDTPDFWRRSGESYPSHAGRFTGEPSYFHHVKEASKRILERNKLTPKDFDYAVFHMPNAKFPKRVALSLGFNLDQIERSLVVKTLGNSYSASALMGLASVLELAKSNQRIFFCSYGSGAGSDAFIFETTELIEKIKLPFSEMIRSDNYLDYFSYRKNMMSI